MAKATEFIVIRQIKTDMLSIVRVVRGYKPPTPHPGYTWGGPYPTRQAAMKAIGHQDESLREQLYPSTGEEAAVSPSA